MKTVIRLQSGIVAIKGYFKFERACRFSVQLIISVSGCYSIINRHCLEALRILANKTRPSERQQYQRRRINILNRRGGSNLQDNYSNIGGFTQHRLIKKSISSANTIGAVITELNTLTPLHLFVMISPINKAVASGKGNRLFTG